MTPTDLNMLKLEAGGMIWATVVKLADSGRVHWLYRLEKLSRKCMCCFECNLYPSGYVYAAVFGSIWGRVLSVRGDNGSGGDRGEFGDGNEMWFMEKGNLEARAAPATTGYYCRCRSPLMRKKLGLSMAMRVFSLGKRPPNYL
ncbi:predicted protein [Sclerotinia sclerotiorum 1980 UF-70]|uniref:Uncharacterized protein n=2 Tax=Sclerotinia sclerotiorum (strain ATCC 18683 / 1980 / Ss-1) TaxID=665079 RepID=A7EZM6_SCLS1|nr:predicted protein [Sclerotinia sclerotiorum 1980 UF-70]APA12217.1 hypothetical protein sscle_09g069870 [Sclerotinia sclerotiorum 1980 UF-70]EDN94918.1 predicted protein [Sclerotinia sclerotiorum 1980 UF-70]